jgi:hypothetical protein
MMDHVVVVVVICVVVVVVANVDAVQAQAGAVAAVRFIHNVNVVVAAVAGGDMVVIGIVHSCSCDWRRCRRGLETEQIHTEWTRTYEFSNEKSAVPIFRILQC